MKNSQQRIESHINRLSTFTSTTDKGVTRLTYSKEDLQARNYIKEKMKEYGLNVQEDGFGNIFGKLEGSLNDGASVIISPSSSLQRELFSRHRPLHRSSSPLPLLSLPSFIPVFTPPWRGL